MNKIMFLLFSVIISLSLSGQAIKVSSSPILADCIPLITKVLTKAGFSPSFVSLPSERSLQSVNRGTVDLEFFCTESSLANTPDVLKIDVALPFIDTIAVTMEDLKLDTIDELRNYTVVSARDCCITQEQIHIAGLQVDLAPSAVNTLKMLQMGRAQVALVRRDLLPATVKEAGLTGYFVHDAPLPKISVYVIINKQQAPYLPRLKEAFKSWKESGQWEIEMKKVVAIASVQP